LWCAMRVKRGQAPSRAHRAASSFAPSTSSPGLIPGQGTLHYKSNCLPLVDTPQRLLSCESWPERAVHGQPCVSGEPSPLTQPSRFMPPLEPAGAATRGRRGYADRRDPP
jgi:hypothetical protein